MVHRDIKPHNLILTRDGRKQVVKILDFGLAKATSEKGEDRGLTGTGQMLGTPDYIAPEQARDATHADIRADIYSLGCTLYFLLSGGPPFSGRSAYEVMEAHNSVEARPLNLVRPEVPEELAALVRRMMAKVPARRHQSPIEAARALLPFIKPGARGVLVDRTPPAPSRQTAENTAAKSRKTQPATPPAAPAAEKRPVAAARSAGDIWATLTDNVGPSAPARKRRRPVARKVWLTGVGFLLISLLGLWAGGLFKVKAPNGPAASEDEPADGEARVDLGGGVMMEFVRIPAGKFLMGSPKGERDEFTKKYAIKPDIFDNAPEHGVEITHDFYLGKYAVTRRQFRVFLRDTGYRTEAEAEGGGWGWDQARKEWRKSPEYNWRNPGFEQSDDHPVVEVSWNDAMKFCAWVGKKAGREVRLPTEAEWEYACRAGSPARYFFGDDEAELARYANVADASFRKVANLEPGIQADDGYAFTAPVGKFRPNVWGLYDMHGNVWQWCLDWYDKGHYAKSLPTDPQGPSNGEYRIFRGGSWCDSAFACRADYRHRGAPSCRNSCVGFRVAGSTSIENASLPPLTLSADAQPPQGPPDAFVPLFNGKDLAEWRRGEQGSWRVDPWGVIAGEGPDASIITRREDYKDFTLRVELSASADAEAYVLMRAGHEPGGLRRGMSTRVFGDGSTVWAGHADRAFVKNERGMRRLPFKPGEFFTLEAHVSGDVVWIHTNGQVTAGCQCPTAPVGAVGLAVTKGTLRVLKMEIKEVLAQR
jgi:formylglycine-generating enzyme required for sulfatase activity